MRCEQYRDMMVDVLYGELGDKERRRFDEHVAGCDACSSALAGMRETLDVMARRERRDPGRAYWDGYWDRLSARMESEGVTRDRSNVIWWRRTVPARAWAYRAAAAAAILVVGVFVGRTFFPAPSPVVENRAGEGTISSRVADSGEDKRQDVPREEMASTEEIASRDVERSDADQSQTPSVSSEKTASRPSEYAPADEPAASAAPLGRAVPGSIQAASADNRAMRYIEKSQLLLIALVNNDPYGDAYAADIGEQRRRSKELVGEAAAIKDDLSDPRQRRLRELVSELEKILMQIANLESDQDLEAVEFIRSRVNDHDVLFKINLEQMRHGDDGSATQGDNLKRSL